MCMNDIWFYASLIFVVIILILYKSAVSLAKLHSRRNRVSEYTIVLSMILLLIGTLLHYFGIIPQSYFIQLFFYLSLYIESVVYNASINKNIPYYKGAGLSAYSVLYLMLGGYCIYYQGNIYLCSIIMCFMDMIALFIMRKSVHLTDDAQSINR